MLDDHVLQNRDVDMQQNDGIPKEMTFAPGEGQTPISVFQDENAEYLAFPSIFCGQTCSYKHRKGNTCPLQLHL